MLWYMEGCVKWSDPKCSNRAGMTLYVLTIVSHRAGSKNLRTTLGYYLGVVTLLICISHCVSGKYSLGMYSLVEHQHHVACAEACSFIRVWMLKAKEIFKRLVCTQFAQKYTKFIPSLICFLRHPRGAQSVRWVTSCWITSSEINQW